MKPSTRAQIIGTILDHVETTNRHIHAAIHNCRRWIAGGYPARSPGLGDRAGSGPSDPTGTQALRGDQFIADLHELDVRLIRARDDLAWIARFAIRYTRPISPTDIQSECADCGRWVSRVGEDRLRAGRCQACYTRRRRKAQVTES